MKKLLSIIMSLLMALTMNAQTVDGRNFGIDGFAAYEGVSGQWYHVGGTTGGAGGEVVYASNLSELQAYLQSSKPYIVLVDKDMNTGITAYVDDLSTGHLCDKQDGSEGVATTYGERIMVADNKTLIGIVNDRGEAPLFSRITFVMQCTSNVIIRNCRFTMLGAPIMKGSKENKIVAWREGAQKEVGDPDCIGIQADAKSAKTDAGGHIWIDHCEFFNGNTDDVDRYDGLLDCKNNIQWVTISYNLFHDHFKACLFGPGNSDSYERKISLHHNYFKDIQGSRLPMQRYGYLHYMNNYMTNAQDGYDLRAGAIGYIDACYFKDSKAPIRLRGEGTTNINLDKDYSIVYDNCLRIINNNPNFTYLNISKVDEEYTWTPGGTNANTWLPTQTWSDYFVNSHDKVMDVPAICEKYSGAGKIEIWKEYASEVPAYSQTNLQQALDTPRTIASSGNTYYTYDANGNRMTVAPAPTAIEQLSDTSDQLPVATPKKVVADGKLVIVKDGKQFNAAGQLVK